LQGDVTKIVDTSGNTVVTYTYDSWGKVLSVTGTLATTVGKKNPIRYRGYYYDTESNLYYLNSRYYDPETGRFISADVVAEGGNLYTILSK
jgi:RHS repeat-associated protein